MSPIEHVWDDLSHRVYARVPPPRNRAQLQHTLLQDWKTMSQILALECYENVQYT
jgi:hypothetical protein